MGWAAQDQPTVAAGFDFRRQAANPMPANPISSIAQVEGSGTAAMLSVPLNGEPSSSPGKYPNPSKPEKMESMVVVDPANNVAAEFSWSLNVVWKGTLSKVTIHISGFWAKLPTTTVKAPGIVLATISAAV